MANNILEFIKAAVRNPLVVSTVFPTSKSLAENLIEHGNIARAEKVVELGAGTGAITKYLLPRLASRDRYLGVELDPRMVDFLRKEFAEGVRFEAGPAENLPEWLQPESVDVVVSSLPWTIFSDQTQDKTIAAILQALKPGGTFVTYICVNALLYPQAKGFIRRLETGFASVERSALEWRNIPPAYVLKSTKA
jgi:phosphatidylethanolamine/phosphatidyl-N-methylethanolamine N-methyltransferase